MSLGLDLMSESDRQVGVLMRSFFVSVFSAVLLAMAASAATAGPERIQLPVFYGTDFVFVDAVDKRSTEMSSPDMVDGYARGKRIIAVCNPTR